MSKSIITLSIALAVSLILCAVVTYALIDRSISYSYLELSYETERKSVEALQKLIAVEWSNMPASQVQKKLERVAAMMPEQLIIVKKEDSIIWFDQTAFKINAGKLESVGAAK